MFGRRVLCAFIQLASWGQREVPALITSLSLSPKNFSFFFGSFDRWFVVFEGNYGWFL